MDGKILSLEVGKKSTKVVYTINEMVDGKNVYKKRTDEIDRKPSSEMAIIFRSLLGHALFHAGLSNGKLGEKEMKSRKVVDMPFFKSYEILKIQITGDGEEEAISFKVQNETVAGSTYPINIPKLFIAAGIYPFEMEVAKDLDDLVKEIRSFIENKNFSPDLFDQPKEEKKSKNKKEKEEEEESENEF